MEKRGANFRDLTQQSKWGNMMDFALTTQYGQTTNLSFVDWKIRETRQVRSIFELSSNRLRVCLGGNLACLEVGTANHSIASTLDCLELKYNIHSTHSAFWGGVRTGIKQPRTTNLYIQINPPIIFHHLKEYVNPN